MVALGIACGPGSMTGGYSGGVGSNSSAPAPADDGGSEFEIPPAMRQHETAAEAAARREAKQKQRQKQQAMRAAGGVARERLSERSGPHRPGLFDAVDWKESTDARSRAMESTYSQLYKPTTRAYWTAQRNGTQPPVRPVQARPVGHLVPSYASALPRALNLGQPAFRALDELNGDDPAEQGPVEHAGADAADETFDPMQEPARVFANFKERVASLREEVQAQPTPLEPLRPALTAASLPPREHPKPPGTEKAVELPPEPEADYRLALPDPTTAVYLTGIDGFESGLIPSWDEPAADPVGPGPPSWDEPLHLT